MTPHPQAPESSSPIRILIADDHGVLRAGLHALLDAAPDMQTVGEAINSAEALQLADSVRPDVILLDISMPGPGGIEVTRQLKATLPHVHVLILTVHEDEKLLRGAINAGASGYITKRAIEPELINAIHAVQRGDLYVHPTMTRALFQGTESTPPTPTEDKASSSSEAPPIESLTPRETEVLTLIAQGYTNREAAEVLSISVRTVETHRANIMGKLHLRGRVALVQYAIEHGLLNTGQS